jgi:hypothetical protein
MSLGKNQTSSFLGGVKETQNGFGWVASESGSIQDNPLGWDYYTFRLNYVKRA